MDLKPIPDLTIVETPEEKHRFHVNLKAVAGVTAGVITAVVVTIVAKTKMSSDALDAVETTVVDPYES